MLARDDPAVLDVVAAAQELSMPPPFITAEQVMGFSLWVLRAVMSGRCDEVRELAKLTYCRADRSAIGWGTWQEDTPSEEIGLAALQQGR